MSIIKLALTYIINSYIIIISLFKERFNMNIERIASLFLLTKGIITNEKAIKIIKDLALINEFKLFYYNILA